MQLIKKKTTVLKESERPNIDGGTLVARGEIRICLLRDRKPP